MTDKYPPKKVLCTVELIHHTCRSYHSYRRHWSPQLIAQHFSMAEGKKESARDKRLRERREARWVSYFKLTASKLQASFSSLTAISHPFLKFNTDGASTTSRATRVLVSAGWCSRECSYSSRKHGAQQFRNWAQTYLPRLINAMSMLFLLNYMLRCYILVLLDDWVTYGIALRCISGFNFKKNYERVSLWIGCCYFSM